MVKKIIIFLVFLSFTNCGYSPIHLKKNDTSFFIKDFKLEGNKKIGKKIINALNIKDTIDYKKKAYILIINSENKIDTLSKDRAGNITVYKTTVSVTLEIKEDGKTIKIKKLSNNFTYNNLDNKFDLSQYQKNIEKNLTNKIIDEIRVFLNF